LVASEIDIIISKDFKGVRRLKNLNSYHFIKYIGLLILLVFLVTLFYPNRVFLTGVNARYEDTENLVEQDIPHAVFLSCYLLLPTLHFKIRV
jgi:hypothetical protein